MVAKQESCASNTETEAQALRGARVERIRKLNDDLRAYGADGTISVTRGIADLGTAAVMRVLAAVAGFDAFTNDNDPYQEHDFGSLEQDGRRVFWKIDYYDRERRYGSPDPADPAVTARVLTIMLAEEY